MKQLPKLLLVVALGALPVSCTTTGLDNVRDVSAAAGGYGIGELADLNDGEKAAAAAGGFLISKYANSKRRKLLATEKLEAREAGRQDVLLETLAGQYALQRGGVDAGQFHEVTVPLESYTTANGVILEPHNKTILAR